jgi:uncharacterized protein
MLRAARQRAGLSQRELAERAATSQPAVNRYERGRVQPRADVLQRLLVACDSDLAHETTTPVSETHNERLLLGPVGYLVARHRDEVLRIVAEGGATNVRVFGSVARAEDTETSDLDLLVDLAPQGTLLDLVRIAGLLDDLLGVRVDVATLDILKPHIRARALAEARRL